MWSSATVEEVHISRKRRAVARRIINDSAAVAAELTRQQIADLLDSLGQKLSPITDAEKRAAVAARKTLPDNGINYSVQAYNLGDTPQPP